MDFQPLAIGRPPAGRLGAQGRMARMPPDKAAAAVDVLVAEPHRRRKRDWLRVMDARCLSRFRRLFWSRLPRPRVPVAQPVSVTTTRSAHRTVSANRPTCSASFLAIVYTAILGMDYFRHRYSDDLPLRTWCNLRKDYSFPQGNASNGQGSVGTGGLEFGHRSVGDPITVQSDVEQRRMPMKMHDANVRNMGRQPERPKLWHRRHHRQPAIGH
jgi:hypothetical protein